MYILKYKSIHISLFLSQINYFMIQFVYNFLFSSPSFPFSKQLIMHDRMAVQDTVWKKENVSQNGWKSINGKHIQLLGGVHKYLVCLGTKLSVPEHKPDTVNCHFSNWYFAANTTNNDRYFLKLNHRQQMMTPNARVAHHPNLCHTFYDAHSPWGAVLSWRPDGSKREGSEMRPIIAKHLKSRW